MRDHPHPRGPVGQEDDSQVVVDRGRARIEILDGLGTGTVVDPYRPRRHRVGHVLVLQLDGPVLVQDDLQVGVGRTSTVPQLIELDDRVAVGRCAKGLVVDLSGRTIHDPVTAQKMDGIVGGARVDRAPIVPAITTSELNGAIRVDVELGVTGAIVVERETDVERPGVPIVHVCADGYRATDGVNPVERHPRHDAVPVRVAPLIVAARVHVSADVGQGPRPDNGLIPWVIAGAAHRPVQAAGHVGGVRWDGIAQVKDVAEGRTVLNAYRVRQHLARQRLRLVHPLDAGRRIREAYHRAHSARKDLAGPTVKGDRVGDDLAAPPPTGRHVYAEGKGHWGRLGGNRTGPLHLAVRAVVGGPDGVDVEPGKGRPRRDRIHQAGIRQLVRVRVDLYHVVDAVAGLYHALRGGFVRVAEDVVHAEGFVHVAQGGIHTTHGKDPPGGKGRGRACAAGVVQRGDQLPGIGGWVIPLGAGQASPAIAAARDVEVPIRPCRHAWRLTPHVHRCGGGPGICHRVVNLHDPHVGPAPGDIDLAIQFGRCSKGSPATGHGRLLGPRVGDRIVLIGLRHVGSARDCTTKDVKPAPIGSHRWPRKGLGQASAGTPGVGSRIIDL